jgi:hypothetical protein
VNTLYSLLNDDDDDDDDDNNNNIKAFLDVYTPSRILTLTPKGAI